MDLFGLMSRTGVLLRGAVIGSAICCMAATSAVALQQQTINSVEILVNDEPISSFDIDQRLRLVIAISGGVKTQKEFEKIREQVIKSMIDERLQIQEAATVDLVIGERQLEDFFARRAQGVGQSPDQFAAALRGIGSSKQSMQSQIAAEVAWSQLVEGRLGSFASVSDEEVDARIAKIRSNRGNFEYRLSEITLDITSAGQENAVKQNAITLAARVQQEGSTFSKVAQQLSTSPSAAVGGDLGWSSLDSLSEEQQKAAETLAVGEVSEPIRTAGGYTVLLLRDRRRILIADPLDNQYGINQLFISKAVAQDTALVGKFRNAVANLHEKSFDCSTIDTVGKEAGVTGTIELGTLRLRDLKGDVRTTVEKMTTNSASRVLDMEDGLRVLVVCSFQEARVQEPDFDAIHDQLEQQRLSMMGRRYLRDLRRDAIIDYR